MKPWRPTKYKEDFDYIKLAEEYLATCGVEQMRLPKLEDFCEMLDIHEDKVSEWSKLYPNSNFHEACKRIMRKQKGTVTDGGFFGGKEVNGSMAIFLLKANHGMIETDRRMLVGANGESLKGFINTNGIEDQTK